MVGRRHLPLDRYVDTLPSKHVLPLCYARNEDAGALRSGPIAEVLLCVHRQSCVWAIRSGGCGIDSWEGIFIHPVRRLPCGILHRWTQCVNAADTGLRQGSDPPA